MVASSTQLEEPVPTVSSTKHEAETELPLSPPATPTRATPPKVLAECLGEKLTDLDRTVWDAFAKAATLCPDNEAIVSMWQTGHGGPRQPSTTEGKPLGGLRWTYRELFDRSVRLAGWLTAGHGDRGSSAPEIRLAAFLWNSAEWGLFLWAAAKAGMTFAPLDPRVLATDGGHFLDVTSPTVVVVQDADAAAALGQKLEGREGIRVRIQCSGEAVPGWTLLQDVWSATESVAASGPESGETEAQPLSAAETAEAMPIAAEATPEPASDAAPETAPEPPVEAAAEPVDVSSEPSATRTKPKFHAVAASEEAIAAYVPSDVSPASPGDTALIVFTSGTTNTPKGCPHTHSNLIAQTHTYDANPDPSHIDRWLVHTPVSHIFAVNNAVRAWRYANCVVFASRAFDVQATLSALVEEQCTIMSAVPTLVKALLANPLFPGKEHLNINVVSIGGTLIRPEDIKLCRDGLGAGDAIQAFGMSEGAPVISWSRSDPLLQDGYHPGVGKILPGANARICAPGTRDVVGRNEVGELHVGGPPVIAGYLGGADAQSFYADEVGSWLATGDQARMDDDGVIYIVGRYKDLIIRGGENIPPLKLEIAIAGIPGVLAQVVGVPDDLAGQVPVAVVKLPEGVGKMDVLAKCRELGPMYALAGVYTLEELGMEGFPITALGKVKKEVLKKAVIQLRSPPEPAPVPEALPAVPEALPTVPETVEPIPEPAPAVELSPLEPTLAAETPDVEASAENTAPSDVPAELAPPEPAPVEPTPAPEATEPTQAQVAPLVEAAETAPVVEPAKTNGSPPSVIEQLSAIWEDLVGVRPDPDDSVSSFADSITLLRYCDRVLTLLGQRLYLQDFIDGDTVARQAALLEQRARQQVSLDKSAAAFHPTLPVVPAAAQFAVNGLAQQLPVKPVNGSLALNGFASNGHATSPSFAVGSSYVVGRGPARPRASSGPTDADIYLSAMGAASHAGFDPSDVEDVMRIKDSFQIFAVGPRPQTYHDRMVFRVAADGVGAAQVRRGVEAALSARPIFRTMLAQSRGDGTPFHVVLRPRPEVLGAMIREVEVETIEDMERLTRDGSAADHDSPLMARFLVVTVKQGGEVYLSATYSHSIFDAMSILPWHLDLERLVADPSAPLAPVTPYKLYADLTHMYSTSLPAEESVAFNVSRLRGISRFASQALWPTQRSPGWMISDDCPEELAADRASVRDELWDGRWDLDAEEFKFPRASRVVSLLGMEKLRATLGVEASLVMKAAVTLFNVVQTRSPYALFNTWSASRSWPFVPAWMEHLLPPPMSIDGPTAEMTLNMCEVRPQETVAELLQRMAAEHELLERHAHAPWFKVLEGLGDEAELAVEATFRQSLVWDVSMAMTRGFQTGGQRKTLEAIARHDWPDCGLYWNAFMVDKVNMFFVASWDTAQMGITDVDGHCDAMAMVLRKLCNEANWDKKVSDVFAV